MFIKRLLWGLIGVLANQNECGEINGYKVTDKWKDGFRCANQNYLTSESSTNTNPKISKIRNLYLDFRTVYQVNHS